jgi:hypothetical protein
MLGFEVFAAFESKGILVYHISPNTRAWMALKTSFPASLQIPQKYHSFSLMTYKLLKYRNWQKMLENNKANGLTNVN